MFSHICLQPDIHHPCRSQAPQADPAENPCWCPSMPLADAHTRRRIRLHHLILPRQGDVTPWCCLQICTSCCWGDQTQHCNSPCTHWNIMQDIIPGTNLHRPPTMHPCWDHHCQLARGPKGCPLWPVGLLEPLWCHDCRGQHHPAWGSHPHPYHGKGGGLTLDPWRTSGYNQMPDTHMKLCVLARNQQGHPTCHWSMQHMPMLQTLPTMCTTQTNTTPIQQWQHLGIDLFEFNQHE